MPSKLCQKLNLKDIRYFYEWLMAWQPWFSTIRSKAKVGRAPLCRCWSETAADRGENPEKSNMATYIRPFEVGAMMTWSLAFFSHMVIG
mgnify:CR=1 FL=1